MTLSTRPVTGKIILEITFRHNQKLKYYALNFTVASIILEPMASITATCAKCGKQFNIIDQEQKFLTEKGLPFPTNCPPCRQTRRLALRGGRQLFKAKCQKCGKDIITSYDPKTVKQMILCKEDYDQYTSENNPIITDPLPEN